MAHRSIHDKRYQRAVKQALNKRFQNKSSLNLRIAGIISTFSHDSSLTVGHHMISPTLDYFLITKVLSPHWVLGRFAPSVLQFADGVFWYVPNYIRSSPVFKKKVFNPFSKRPHIKRRTLKYHLNTKTNESLPAVPGFH